MIVRERWPVTYDAGQLKDQIKELCESKHFPKGFYYHTLGPLAEFQQGDLLHFNSGVPIIWEDGEASVIDEIEYWVVIGNTCDFTRGIGEVPYTQLAPIIEIDISSSSRITTNDLQRYKYSRRFYIPPWSKEVEGKVFLADFQRIVTVHKSAFLTGKINRIASMSRQGWFLFHCCLVRFICRDDGRFAPD